MTKQKAQAMSLIVASVLVTVVGFHNCSGANLPGGFDSLAGGSKVSGGDAVIGGPTTMPILPGIVGGGTQTADGGPRAGASVAGGGDGYDGMSAKAYKAFTRGGQTCPDGSNVASEVNVESNGQVYLTRDNCAPIEPQRIAPNNYQLVSGFDSDYLVIGEQAYYNEQSRSDKTVNFFCHGYTETQQANNNGNGGGSFLGGLWSGVARIVDSTLQLINYSSPQVVSVNAMVAGESAQVNVSRHSPITFALTTVRPGEYSGQSPAGDRLTLDLNTGAVSIDFADGSSAINNMDLTCEVPY